MNEQKIKSIESRICPICCYSKQHLKECPSCQYNFCTGCIMKYLLTSNKMVPDCMNCHKEWSFEFLAGCTNKDFYNREYRDYQAKLLLQIEKSYLPATQEFANSERVKLEIEPEVKKLQLENRELRREHDSIKSKIKTGLGMIEELQRNINLSCRENDIESYSQQKSFYDNEVETLKKTRYSLRLQINKNTGAMSRLRDKYNKVRHHRTKRENKEIEPTLDKKVRYIAPCPVDDCKGFVNNKFTCGMCEKKICGKCYRSLMTDNSLNDSLTNSLTNSHVCKKEDIDTVELLKKDTKPCPKCAVPIHKISGCSQIFCVMCHTAFGWNTGKIETGVIHNPHYYEFLRKTQGFVTRNVGDGQNCNAFPIMYDVTRNLVSLRSRPTEVYLNDVPDWLYSAHQLVQHIQWTELRRFPNVENYGTYRDLRVKYLLGTITEKRWISLLKMREKKRMKNQSIFLILSMFIGTMRDLFSNIVEAKSDNQVSDAFQGMFTLRNYINECFEKLEKRLNNKTYRISDEWTFEPRSGQRTRKRTLREELDFQIAQTWKDTFPKNPLAIL